jgi:hypothetical protein
MKSFKQYISEDIELVSDIGRTGKSEIEDAQDEFTYGPKKNLGKIHKDYSLHKSSGNFYITHDPSKKVVGHISNDTPHKSSHLQVGLTAIHKDHTKKKIGHSLAVAAYKHLHGLGYTVTSGREQSVGGASIWQSLMKDRDIGGEVRAIHHSYGGKRRDLGRASELHTGDIWSSGSGAVRRKAKAKGIQMHPYTGEDDSAYDTHLEIQGKKK